MSREMIARIEAGLPGMGGEERRKIVSATRYKGRVECGLQRDKKGEVAETNSAVRRATAGFVAGLENRRRATVLEFESLRFRHLYR